MDRKSINLTDTDTKSNGHNAYSNVTYIEPNRDQRVKTEIKRDKKGYFAKGVSANPLGRPRTPDAFNELMREYAIEAAQEIRYWMLLRDPRVSPGCAQYILNRAYGMPVQANEISGPRGQPLEAPNIQVNFVKADVTAATKVLTGDED